MTDHEQTRTRLGALKALGAAAAGLVGGTLLGKDTTSASAATGDTLTLGSTANTAEDQTKLTMDGTLAASTSAFVVEAANANAAVEGNSSSIGVLGNATTGVMGVGNVGGVFSGDANAIQLNPQTFAGDAIPTGDDHLKGDVLVDADGVLWLCIADGTPGTWIKVSHGGIRLLPQPQRIYDSRLPAPGDPILAGTTRTVPILGMNDVDGSPLAVPSEALGIVCNLTVTGTTSLGFLQAWPEGPRPTSGSNLNWGAAGITVANAATVRLGSDGSIRLYVERSDADAIVDVSAYIL